MNNTRKTTIFGAIGAIGALLQFVCPLVGNPAWLSGVANLLIGIGSGGVGYFSAGIPREVTPAPEAAKVVAKE